MEDELSTWIHPLFEELARLCSPNKQYYASSNEIHYRVTEDNILNCSISQSCKVSPPKLFHLDADGKIIHCEDKLKGEKLNYKIQEDNFCKPKRIRGVGFNNKYSNKYLPRCVNFENGKYKSYLCII